MRFTARARLETWAHASRVQSDEATYDLERTVVDSVVAGVTADRCGQCGACDRAVVSVAVGNGEAGDMAITETAYAEAQAEIGRLRTALENMRRECDRAWREVDAMASERKQHARWRQNLADQLGEVEKHRDAIAVALNKRENDLMAAHNAVAQMMVRRSFATGHGDTVLDMVRELEWQIVELQEFSELDCAIPSGGTEAGPEEDRLEAAYWRFDARHKGYGKWKQAPMSERDAFKAEMRNALSAEKTRAEMRLAASGWSKRNEAEEGAGASHDQARA